MLRLVGCSRAVALLLAAVLLVEAAPLGAIAQDEKTAFENVRFEVSGELVRVTYDLLGPAEKVHRVRVTLLRESDSLFLYRPVNLTGDVGAVVFPGRGRRVTWEFTKEFPDGLTGDDFYFVLEAEQIQSEGISPLVWVGGGVVLVGGVVALILAGGGGTESEKPGEFPRPPGRP